MITTTKVAYPEHTNENGTQTTVDGVYWCIDGHATVRVTNVDDGSTYFIEINGMVAILYDKEHNRLGREYWGDIVDSVLISDYQLSTLASRMLDDHYTRISFWNK